MNAVFYLLIPLVLFTILLYPLLRKAVSLLEILVNKYVQSQAKQQTLEAPPPPTNSPANILNLKFLAYERIVLLIERLKPDSLIPRTLSSTLSCKEYQLLLLSSIRQEFEYNLSQQLYLSENAWSVTVNFKDHIITLINSAAAECAPSDNANQLAKRILEQYISSSLQADQILRVIKSECKPEVRS